MMTRREAAVSRIGGRVLTSSAVSTLQQEILPWNAARYFYSMADRMMLV